MAIYTIFRDYNIFFKLNKIQVNSILLKTLKFIETILFSYSSEVEIGVYMLNRYIYHFDLDMSEYIPMPHLVDHTIKVSLSFQRVSSQFRFHI